MATFKWTNKASLLAAIKRWPDIFEEEFQSAIVIIAELLRGAAVELTPSGGGSGPLGHLGNSIQVGHPVATPTGHQITYGTAAEYADVVEHGRKAGGPMPPLEAIAQWIWETRQNFPDVKTEKDALHLAFPIARAIAKNGTEGAHMFEQAEEQEKDAIFAVTRDMKQRIEDRCTLMGAA